MRTLIFCAASAALLLGLALLACGPTPHPDWEAGNPIQPLPEPPLGINAKFSDLPEPPTPQRVRLGRWLFYDTRLSKDGTVSCATCHRPENGFSEPTPVSTGIDGKRGNRKAPPVLNLAWTLYTNFFWDGRAASLEDQALGPIQNPIEMGHTIEGMIANLEAIQGYRKYFNEAFGSDDITKERVAKAIADYERTRMSGNSPWDRWRFGKDESAVSDQVKLGHELFFGKAECSQCHFGDSFTDNSFHNLGVGWNPENMDFLDRGRSAISEKEEETGAFKTPTLREVAVRAPYMHDGSMFTLQEVVEHYNRGGNSNPYLDPKVRPLELSHDEVAALVAFMEALSGEGYQDTTPKSFPQ